MNSQPYAFIHYDEKCMTLNEAIRKMNAIPNPVFCYEHIVYANNINSDLAYAPYITHDVINEIMILKFPKECNWIANVRNNYKCNMVMHYKDIYSYLNKGNYFKEIAIDSSMNIDTRTHQETTLRIYTKGYSNLEIYFDMYLMKPIKSKL